MNTAIMNSALALALSASVVTISHIPSAFAAAPYLAGPSIMGLHESAVFNGGNFPPNVALRLIVNYPDKTQYKQVILPDGEGSLSYQVALTTPGRYTLVIRNAAGALLKSVSFVVSK
jgi:hypothetical protein